MEEKPEIKKVALGIAIGVVVIGLVIYAGYSYSQKQGVKITLPGGTTYIGEKGSFNLNTPPTAPQRFTVAADTPWITYQGKAYSYSLSYPETLPLASFPKDPSDAVGIGWGNLNPQFNILLDVESVKERDPQNLGKTEAFVRNWWKNFSGLKGVSSVDKFTNAGGLKGYKAIYVNQAGQTPNLDIFFEVPQNRELVIHLANGILDPFVFNRIVNSVKYNPVTEAATPAP